MTTRPTAEIVSIGSELLSGDTIDTNSSHIARILRELGIELRFISAVSDDENLISETVERGLSRSNVVITTGGVGPTVDDKTRAAVALATGHALRFRPHLLKQIESRFALWGRVMSENNRQQAYTPDGAIEIENPIGTAPCFMVEHGNSIVICLPGVPLEMIYLLDNNVAPYLRSQFPAPETIKTRVLHTVGLGESVVDSKIGDLESLKNPTVGLAAHQGIVDILITATAINKSGANQLIARVEKDIRDRLGKAIFGADQDSLAGIVLDHLSVSGLTVSSIESGTRGQLAEKLTLTGDIRGVFHAGMIYPKYALTNDLELGLKAMTAYCMESYHTDLSVACLVMRTGNTIDIGVAVSNSSNKLIQTKLQRYGGHADYSGEWGANLSLNLLRNIHV